MSCLLNFLSLSLSFWEKAISYIIITISWAIKSHAQNEQDIFLKQMKKNWEYVLT